MRPYVSGDGFEVHHLCSPSSEFEPTLRHAVDGIFSDLPYIEPGDPAMVGTYLDGIAEPLETLMKNGLALYAIDVQGAIRNPDGTASAPWEITHFFVVPYVGYFRAQIDGAPVHKFRSPCGIAGADLRRVLAKGIHIATWLLPRGVEISFESTVPWCVECCLEEASALRGKDCIAASLRLRTTSEVVERAIRDAEALMKSGGPTSALDRVHTALQGYLMTACDDAGIHYDKDPSMLHLYSQLRGLHPKLQVAGPLKDPQVKVMRAFASIVDALSPARNRGSMAHPNQELLDEQEAALFINAARTVLHYLDAKLSS